MVATRFRMLAACGPWLVAWFALALGGCSSSTTPAPQGNDRAGGSAGASAVPDEDPKTVVTRFLNALKSSDTATVESLLTTKARTELPKHNMHVQAIGSEKASFEIASVKYPEDKKGVAYVACYWQEPAVSGQKAPPRLEVVWVVKQDGKQGWRVAGLAMDGTNQEVVFFDFENPKSMLEEQQRYASSDSEAPKTEETVRTARQPAEAPKTKTKTR